MKTKQMLLSGFMGILVLLSSATISAVASSKKETPDSKTPTIALFRYGTFQRAWFAEIKTALEDEGYKTKVVLLAKDLKGDGIALGIALTPHPVATDRLFIAVCHNQNDLLAKCIMKKLARRTKLMTEIPDVDNVDYLSPGDPIVLVLVDPADIEKHCDRYAQGIVDGVEYYLDKLD